MTDRTSRGRRENIVAALLGVAAFVLVLVITELPGPGLDPDALAYLGGAESVAAHGTYRMPSALWSSADSTEPLAHFPPGYSTVLAVPVRLGMAPPQAARLVQAIAAFVTVTTLALLVSATTSWMLAVFLALSLLVMTSMHEVHVSVLSEPLYLACLSLVLVAMVRAPTRPLYAGIPAAVGLMTRYAGLSLVGAVVVWSLVQAGSWSTRMKRAAIACLPALLLEIPWVIRTREAQGAEEIRTFAVYGNLGKTLAQGAATITAWLVPDAALDSITIPHRGAIAIAVVIVLAVLVSIGVLRARWATRSATPAGESTPRLLSAIALLVVCYLGLVGASRLLADPDIPLDERILAPVLLLLTTFVAVGLYYWWSGTRLIVARVVVGIALGVWWCGSFLATRDEVHYALAYGSDLAGMQWSESELLSWTHGEGRASTLWSNWPAAVYFHLHRPARELPKNKDMTPTTLAAFVDSVRKRDGRVLLFNTQDGEYPSNAVLRKLPGLRLLDSLRDGIVLSP